jgi:hypothetical protein
LRGPLHVHEELRAERLHPERSPVQAVEQVARLLELDGEEEGARGVGPRAVDAAGVRAALRDLILPEG